VCKFVLVCSYDHIRDDQTSPSSLNENAWSQGQQASNSSASPRPVNLNTTVRSEPTSNMMVLNKDLSSHVKVQGTSSFLYVMMKVR